MMEPNFDLMVAFYHQKGMFEDGLRVIQRRREILSKFMQEIDIKMEATLAPFLLIHKDFDERNE